MQKLTEKELDVIVDILIVQASFNEILASEQSNDIYNLKATLLRDIADRLTKVKSERDKKIRIE